MQYYFWENVFSIYPWLVFYEHCTWITYWSCSLDEQMFFTLFSGMLNKMKYCNNNKNPLDRSFINIYIYHNCVYQNPHPVNHLGMIFIFGSMEETWTGYILLIIPKALACIYVLCRLYCSYLHNSPPVSICVLCLFKIHKCPMGSTGKGGTSPFY